MADILIRGMDKPFNCFACDLSRLSGERLFCCVTKDEVLRYKIASDCPLHELPEHGDLISKDDAMNAILEERNVAHHPAWFAGIVNEIPAIVPSNKEETE